MRSIRWSLALCAFVPVAAAGSETTSVRGYTLTGEILLYPAADQKLPDGWSIVSEATGDSMLFQLGGASEIVRDGDAVRTLFSQAMPTNGGQILLRDEKGESIALGDLMAAFHEGGWELLSSADELARRPVFEIPEASRTIGLRNADELVFSGEIALGSDLVRELGIAPESTYVVGSLILIASPYFDAAKPVVENAAPVVTVGPDVIVSTIGSTISKNGTVGSITAYSMTTVSCNIGDANAIWIDCGSGSNCNQHPVIGQEMYRLKTVAGATRFEQIGMSWLKHGFCAADAPSCTNLVPGSSYAPNGSCDWLGLFATDTYDASLNGSQGNLGPRSEVNAWSGVFPYPYLNNGCGSGTAICKRLQIQNGDLDPAANPGAQYVAEVVYIATDESHSAGSVTPYNNYSVRKIQVGSMSGGGYNLSFTGGTIPMVAAPQWWAQNDPGVTLIDVDVPGDGRLTLGCKVTQTGGGQYHYEYLLFNRNSDRCVQAISVPLSTGALCNNVGFHDVDYHSGEPYSLADWTPTVVPNSSVSWACETFAQNANANALRWSTSYNYRFDSNAAPTTGDVTLTLFKPGSPTSVVIPGVEVPGSTCAAFTYCTSSTTTGGCSPQISATGTPSASTSSGFTIDCSGLEPAKAGLFFFGNQQTAVAWAVGSSSTRCVTAPVMRTPVQDSAGSTGCDGAYSFDWNAWRSTVASGTQGPWAVGQTYYGQYWFRDPSAVTSTNLSNAVGFTLCQ
jgi:hypothetical protein